jgi:hypothetical protein
MRRIRLTEGQLHRIIRNAVNESLCDKHDIIKIGGSREKANFLIEYPVDDYYRYDTFTALAEDAQSALERVVAYIEKKKWFGLFWDDYVDEMDEEERDQMEDGGEITLVDATEYGAKKLHWIPMANMIIKEE